MESIENYNVMLIHGAYGKNKGFLDVKDTARLKEAYVATKPLDNGAALGRYHAYAGNAQESVHKDGHAPGRWKYSRTWSAEGEAKACAASENVRCGMN